MFLRFLVPLALSGFAYSQTYSYIQDPGIPIMRTQVVKVYRDGSKELIEQTMPAGVMGREKEYHGRTFYDFQAHKLYVQVLSDPGAPCGLQDLAETTAPSMLDPVGAGADLLKELVGKGTITQVGTETINGIPTKVMMLTASDGNGKVWLAQNGGYPVRIDSIDKDGKASTMLEVKQLSLAKPTGNFFTPPGNCVAAMQSGPPPKPSTNVTAITLQPIAKYTGACPAHIKLTGTITVYGPGKVFYQFGAGNMEPGETLTFDAAGAKTVSHVMTFQPKYGNDMGGSAILEAIGMDDGGHHDLAMKGSNNSDFTITCTSGGGK
jgi:hypothetical protein